MLIVKIPTRKFLRDFLAFYFNDSQITFDPNSEEYLFLRSLLSTKSKPDPKDNFFDSFVSLKVSKNAEDRKIVHVDNSAAHRFYQHYYKVFKDYFLQEINSKREDENFTIESSIRLFCARFNWTEEHIKHDTLLKLYQRHGMPMPRKTNKKLEWTPPTVFSLSFL